MRSRTPLLNLEQADVASRFLRRSSSLALCFFLISSLVLTTATLGAFGLAALLKASLSDLAAAAVPCFVVSSLFLIAGSWALHDGCQLVRIEKQEPFRWRLLIALGTGTLFVMTQCVGLWCLVTRENVAQQLGLRAGAFVFVVMHGMHFVVALLCVIFVLLRAVADRYDHEYSWGVVFCGWFWHALGIAWIVIAAAYVIAASAVPPEVPEWLNEAG